MQIGSLNRIIATLVVGGVLLGWGAWRWSNRLFEYASAHKAISDSLSLFFFVMLFVVAAIIIGLLVDAITDVLVREFVFKKWIHKRRLYWLFVQSEMFMWFEVFEHSFGKAAKERQSYFKYAMIDDSVRSRYARGWSSFNESEFNRRMAAGLLLCNASKEQIDWLNSHHSTYLLSSNLVTVFVVMLAFEISESSFNLSTLWTLVIASIVIYSLVSLSLDRYLYSYILAFRFSLLHQPDSGRPVQRNMDGAR